MTENKSELIISPEKKKYKTPENIRKANIKYYHSRRRLQYLCDCCKHISGCKSHMTDHIRSVKHIKNLRKYEGEVKYCIYKIRAC